MRERVGYCRGISILLDVRRGTRAKKEKRMELNDIYIPRQDKIRPDKILVWFGQNQSDLPGE
jgi:hypothetical protein